MKQKDYTYIEKQMERFFSGETNHAEEKELYAFFSENEIPEEWEKYRDVFDFFKNDLPKELKDINPGNIPLQSSRKSSRIGLGIAATLLVLVISGSFYLLNKNNKVIEENFVVINGEKITDPKIVESEINTALLKYVLEEIEINTLLMDSDPGYRDGQWDYIEVTIRE